MRSKPLQEAFKTWSKTGPTARRSILLKIADEFRKIRRGLYGQSSRRDRSYKKCGWVSTSRSQPE